MACHAQEKNNHSNDRSKFENLLCDLHDFSSLVFDMQGPLQLLFCNLHLLGSLLVVQYTSL